MSAIIGLPSGAPDMSRSLIISNFVLFQIGWFACVLGGANQLALVGSLVALILIALHIWRAQAPLAEIRLLLVALGIGIVFESILTFTNISQYADGILFEGFAPHWMVLMWGLFATTLNVSMRWVKSLPLPAIALLGAILAPLSYLAGNRLGAVVFPDTTLALITIALGWVILFPLLVVFARRNDGYAIAINADSKASEEEYANV